MENENGSAGVGTPTASAVAALAKAKGAGLASPLLGGPLDGAQVSALAGKETVPACAAHTPSGSPAQKPGTVSPATSPVLAGSAATPAAKGDRGVSPQTLAANALGGACPNAASLAPLTQPLPHNAPPVEIKLFVGRVPQTVDEDALRPIFEGFGDVREVFVIRDKNTLKHKNSAFVKMASLAAADACIRALHSNRILDAALGPIIVKYATGEAERLGMHSLGMGGEGGGVDQAKLFVGSIPRTMSEDELRVFFQTYGTVEEVFVMKDSATGTGKGCAFVKFKYKEEGLHAMRNLNGKHIFEGCTRPVEVRFAESKSQRQQQMAGQHNLGGLGGWGGGGVMTQAGLSGMSRSASTLAGSNANPRQAGQWKEYFAPDGRPYYHNEYTNVTTWERPPEFDHLPLASLALGGNQASMFSGGVGLHHGSVNSGIGGSETAGPPGANVFVFHIPNEWTKADLIQTFSGFGNIVSCHIAVDKVSHRNRGFAFVSYDNVQSAANAVNHMNGCLAANKRLNVSIKKGEEHHVQHLLNVHGAHAQGHHLGPNQHGKSQSVSGSASAHGMHPHGASGSQQGSANASLSGSGAVVGLGSPLQQAGGQSASVSAQGGQGTGNVHASLSSHLQLAAVGSPASGMMSNSPQMGGAGQAFSGHGAQQQTWGAGGPGSGYGQQAYGAAGQRFNAY
ncbi:CUG-BP-and ETR-3-like factor 3, related [Neospora caninum Liverpool]|uniref:CUG-BP-and ETR-3-like factor 3, related n=1 Tax=Neospora caninum (strain Liverpool) TaxID=572307 RepID=F0VJV6_NEOCL|nr:CUG-BP-and ETR-3-like factor 3, related [Neospora caninum Liverpool]CBZ54017.1 CUG-BP-and ETR-3-like factor 3, related [Neospora caninum Liverpool]CEL68021.1 TPA: CUG-BP-and ETR-3-like factor 3, related [Neospora caninum Liverpool]|eukprot:XP_003884049.1 CUG-BP-and ETR-3-like factor 3, related [Neospora caninum Liverpool]